MKELLKKNEECYVYHIKAPLMNIHKGYVGISNNPEYRFKQGHSKSKKYNVAQNIIDYELTYEHNVHIIFAGERKDCLAIEYQLRPLWRMGWNIRPGGEDGFGERDETIYNFIHEEGAQERCTRKTLEDLYDLDHGNLSRMIAGTYKTSKGWKVESIYKNAEDRVKGVKRRGAQNKKIYNFKKGINQIKCTQYDLREENPEIDPSGLNDVCKGKALTCRGWSIDKTNI